MSDWPKPKFVKPVLRASVWREEKLTGLERGPLDAANGAGGVLSTYDWDGGACAVDRCLEGETAELLTCGMFPDGLSPQAGLALGLHSVAELATRELDPVLASERLVGAAEKGALSMHESVLLAIVSAVSLVAYLGGARCLWPWSPMQTRQLGHSRCCFPTRSRAVDVRVLCDSGGDFGHSRAVGSGFWVSTDVATRGEGGTHIAGHGCHITTKVTGGGAHVHRSSETGVGAVVCIVQYSWAKAKAARGGLCVRALVGEGLTRLRRQHRQGRRVPG